MTAPRHKIQVFISYKTTNKPELKTLEQAFEKYNDNQESLYQFQVVYSENTLNEGDNIIDFMDEISVAGMVVFLFSEDYFQSHYCWYELITSYEKGNIENRATLLPIQFSDIEQDEKIAKLKESICKWKNNEGGQQALSKLLGVTENKVLERIETVEAGFLNQWFEGVINEKNSDETVQDIEQAVCKVVEEENKKFDAALLKNIKNELRRITNLQESWKYYAGNDSNVEGIAKELMAMNYEGALVEIKEWSQEEYERKLTSWNMFFNRIQRLAGWFVLKSIKPDWWINHKLAFTDGLHNQESISLFLKEEQLSYSEIVVSRGLLDRVKKPDPALFVLDNKHDVIPQGKQSLITEYNSFVIDPCDEAEVFTVLTPLFIDVKKIKPTEKDTQKLLAEFIRLLKADKQSYFYLVREAYLQQLKACQSPVNSDKTLLTELCENLKEKLIFIVIDAPPNPAHVDVADAPEMALTYMQKILLIDKTYHTSQ